MKRTYWFYDQGCVIKHFLQNQKNMIHIYEREASLTLMFIALDYLALSPFQ